MFLENPTNFEINIRPKATRHHVSFSNQEREIIMRKRMKILDSFFTNISNHVDKE